MTITRRALTAGAAMLAALGVLRRDDIAAAERALLAALSDRDTAARIGRALAMDHRQLAVAILAGVNMSATAAAGADTKVIRAKLAQAIRQDYAAGLTIKRDGWLLTITEARLCALAAHNA